MQRIQAMFTIVLILVYFMRQVRDHFHVQLFAFYSVQTGQIHLKNRMLYLSYLYEFSSTKPSLEETRTRKNSDFYSNRDG